MTRRPAAEPRQDDPAADILTRSHITVLDGETYTSHGVTPNVTTLHGGTRGRRAARRISPFAGRTWASANGDSRCAGTSTGGRTRAPAASW